MCYFDGHPGVLCILRLFLICGKLNVFIVDIFVSPTFMLRGI